ncbi:MAG: hypothetical protein ABR567_08380 [Myxococcales bacterium]|nr:hypothetical protein [Myxococcales bacterium]
MAPNEALLGDESVLAARARRAYELGRMRWSLRFAPAVAAAFVAAVACGRPLDLCAALAAAALLVAVGLSFAGGDAGRAVAPGLVAGSFALVLPLAVRTIGHLCLGEACMSLCMPSCVIGGALAGGFLALRAARDERGGVFLVSAVAIAGLTGSLGCTLAGMAGVCGMLAGVLVAGTPVLLAARR